MIAQKYGAFMFEYYDSKLGGWKLYKKTKPTEIKRGTVYRMNVEEFEIAGSDAESLNVLLEQKKDETGAVIRILHIYLDERDLRDVTWHDLQPNGFTEPRLFNDFPQREHKVLLHVRRRRWLDQDGRNVILESLPLVAEGTCYSVEFADFLKKMVGHLPCDGPMRGALLPD